MNRILPTLMVACLALAGAACSSDSKVGDDDTLAFDEQVGERIGEVERDQPTTVPPSTAAPTTAPPTTAPRTTAPPTTRAAAPGAVTIEITSQRYEPFNFAVKKGTTINVVNRDSQPRTFTSDDPGRFDSGMIAPGGSWSYVADTVGKFNFHDETRPFVVGQMEVTA